MGAAALPVTPAFRGIPHFHSKQFSPSIQSTESFNQLQPNRIQPNTNPTQPNPTRWISACGYAFAAVIRNQFQDTAFSCADGLNPSLVKTMQQLMPSSALLRSSAVERMLLRPGDDCVMDMNAVTSYFGINQEVWVYALALVAYLMVVHAMTFVGLLMLARKERR